MAKDDLTDLISFRITAGDRALMNALADRLPMKALSIARVAMQIGLDVIDKDPGALLRPIGSPAKKARRKAKPSP